MYAWCEPQPIRTAISGIIKTNPRFSFPWELPVIYWTQQLLFMRSECISSKCLMLLSDWLVISPILASRRYSALLKFAYEDLHISLFDVMHPLHWTMTVLQLYKDCVVCSVMYTSVWKWVEQNTTLSHIIWFWKTWHSSIYLPPASWERRAPVESLFVERREEMMQSWSTSVFSQDCGCCI